MKVKAVDIARELGISAATVSLAINNRGGVSEVTKQKVLECKEKLESTVDVIDREEEKIRGVIKYIVFMRGFNIVREAELNFCGGVYVAMDRIVKGWGCSLEIEYYDNQKESPEMLAFKCNDKSVLGVLIEGVEMLPEDKRILSLIRKPLVVHDVDLGNKYPCVVFDDAEAVKQAVYYLMQRKMKNIVYLAFDLDVYNFSQRKEGFRRALQDYNLYSEKSIVYLGTSIEDMKYNLKKYLDTNEIPDAFVTECFPVSVVLLQCLKNINVKIPEDVSVIGFDEMPEYIICDYHLSAISVPHLEKMKMALLLLRHEMEDQNQNTKSRINVKCGFQKGHTVREIK